MNVLLPVFAACMAVPVAGWCADRLCGLRRRRLLAVAFARGRAECRNRPPMQVEPLPTFRAVSP